MIQLNKSFFLNYENSRTKRANINIILSLIFRAGTILLQFALVPLTIDYIKPNTYGVWITIFSLVTWVALLDIGIASGLKNNLSKSLAKNNYADARAYISSTYFLISLFALSLIVVFLIASYFINWQNVFNANFISEHELQSVVFIVFAFFLLKFVIDIINIVAASFQHTSINSILLFFSNLGLFVAILVLSRATKPDILLIAFWFSIIPFIISLGATIYLYHNKYAIVKPSWRFVDLKKSRGIMSLGVKFFILQIATLIIFQTDNILIANFFNPEKVTVFNVIYKYYSSVTILFTIIISPYWTAFTEAYVKHDFPWLKKIVRGLINIWFWSLGALFVLLIIAKPVIKFWVGTSIDFDFPLSISIFLYTAIFNWNSIYGSFLNGVGKIHIQIICVIIVGLANIPLTIFLVKGLNWGTYAMPIANFACLSVGAVIGYVQYRKIVEQKATGIWNK